MKWYYNMKLSKKLILGYILIALISAGVGAVAITSLQSISNNSYYVFTNYGNSQGDLGYIAEAFQQTRAALRDLLLEKDPSNFKKYQDTIASNDLTISKHLSEFKKTEQTAEEIANYTNLEKSLNDYKLVREQIVTLIMQNRNTEAYDLLQKSGVPIGAVAAKSIDDNIEQNITIGARLLNSSQNSSNRTILILIGFVIIAAIASILLGLLISSIITKTIKTLLVAANKISEGDLNIDINIDTKDEIGNLAQSFRKVVSAIKLLTTDANMLVTAAVEGKLETRADASKHNGDYKKIVDGINKTLDEITKPIKEASTVLKEMSNGNLGLKVKGEYKGDNAEIKNALNETIDSLSIYINEISNVLERMSNSDLDLVINAEYKGNFSKIKDALNLIIFSFNEVFSDINNSAEQVASGSMQVSDGSQSLSQGATEQASSVEELTTSITQIAAQTRENATNASRANELVLTAKGNAEQGADHMNEMLNSMKEINDSSSKISSIIKVISDIAFQTNILALNAAVEAARAGQHGKGFAVVAEEVRNLAARSANAAKETTDLIETSIKKVEIGTQIANDTSKALSQIVGDVIKATDLVGDIASASNEQATAIEQINKGIEQVSRVVITNSATAEESAAASEELSSQAELLRQMVGNFKLKKDMSSNRYVLQSTKYTQSNARSKKDKLSSLSEAAATLSSNSKPKIKLSDNEFDKY